MKRFIVALTLALAAGAHAAPMEPVLEAGGEWHGVGVQTGDIHWPIEVKMSPDTSTIAYPSFGCEGLWEPLRVTEKGLIAIEKIEVGIGTCSNGGVVRVSVIEEDQLEYVWFDATGKPAAKAILIPGKHREDLYEALLELTMTGLDMDFLTTGEIGQDAEEL